MSTKRINKSNACAARGCCGKPHKLALCKQHYEARLKAQNAAEAWLRQLQAEEAESYLVARERDAAAQRRARGRTEQREAV